MSKEKTIWIREYRVTGRFTCTWEGAYAVRKYRLYTRNKSPVEYYAISVSPKRKSWYKDFLDFHSASKFARNIVKRRN